MSVKRSAGFYAEKTLMPKLVSGRKIMLQHIIIHSTQWGPIELYFLFSSMIIRKFESMSRDLFFGEELR